MVAIHSQQHRLLDQAKFGGKSGQCTLVQGCMRTQAEFFKQRYSLRGPFREIIDHEEMSTDYFGHECKLSQQHHFGATPCDYRPSDVLVAEYKLNQRILVDSACA